MEKKLKTKPKSRSKSKSKKSDNKNKKLAILGAGIAAIPLIYKTLEKTGVLEKIKNNLKKNENLNYKISEIQRYRNSISNIDDSNYVQNELNRMEISPIVQQPLYPKYPQNNSTLIFDQDQYQQQQYLQQYQDQYQQPIIAQQQLSPYSLEYRSNLKNIL